MHVKFLRIAFMAGALAVALGAFGAHALRAMLDKASMETYQTGVQYHFIHTLALAVTGILLRHYPHRWLRWAGNLFIIGLVIFSGSLYALTFLKVANIAWANKLGMITPFGGLSFIAAWLCLAVGISKVD